MKKKNSVRGKLARLAVVGSLTLILSALFVEALLIVLDPIFFQSFFQYDPDIGYRVRPHADYAQQGVFTNQFGFNDKDYPLQKSPGTQRILVVGDSFGWAGKLDGNYTAILERMLETQSEFGKVEVINAGYPGTHTGEQLLMLKKFGLQYNPDLVILGFFVGNDFLDADPNRKRIAVNDCLVDIDRRNEHRLFGYPIIFHSRAWLMVNQKVETRKRLAKAKKEAAEWAAVTGQAEPEETIPEETFLLLQRSKLEVFNKITSGRKFAANFDYVFESIIQMNEILKSHNAKFMVAIYPDEMQVSKSQFNELAAKFNLQKNDYDLDLAQTRLKSFLETRQIPYLDLTEIFRTEEASRELYLFRNTHWNQAGNEVAAHQLLRYLTSQRYLTAREKN